MSEVQKRYLSRRDFLKLGALVTASAALASCAPAIATLSPTIEAPKTPTTEVTPTNIATETANPTPPPPTPEIKQFSVCTPENFRDCPITVEDLFNGNYLKSLYTLSQPFNPSIVSGAPLTRFTNDMVSYPIGTAPNFDVKGSESFRRDVTAGHVQFQGIDYVVMPIEYFDKNNPDQNQWVITVMPFNSPGHVFTKEEELHTINVWRQEMNITVFMAINKGFFSGKPDPLVAKTFAKFPDMSERVDRFIEGDMSALSEPGIVLLNFIASEQGSWFK